MIADRYFAEQRERMIRRLNESEPWELVFKYLSFFALECHYTPQDVLQMPWQALISLTLTADDINQQRKDEANRAALERARTT